MKYASLSLQYDAGAPPGFRRGWKSHLGGKTFGGVFIFLAYGPVMLSLETA